MRYVVAYFTVKMSLTIYYYTYLIGHGYECIYRSVQVTVHVLLLNLVLLQYMTEKRKMLHS